MLRLVRGVFSLLVVLSIAWAGWRWGDALFPALGERLAGAVAGTGSDEGSSPAPAPSPDLAEATLDRVEAFMRDAGPAERLELDAVELSSVLRYTLPGIVPPGVSDPLVELADGRVRLGASVALAAFPDMPQLGDIAGILPDTVPIVLTAALLPFDRSQAALQIERVEAARIPLPDRMIPPILEALGRRSREGLPPYALAVPLPTGLARVFVDGDRLVLVADG